ncbi:fumarylacetoacetate hydrolase family protein [Stylonychia lemnae]|uniref:Fumarylacetoacetate hydrolase family protein n=1 Tax=Stylonychia lemnae TaxID=5949 RepID=A0A078AF27_STYLE|nr:fumarylacetoacetate hydrolase family protein [Stylonychia lemnae]|eukprot:CDW80127.1 fumarylacetoacetate hydrolase family protein [Stylonychia lemnae]
MSAVSVQQLYRSLYNTKCNKILCVGRNYVAHAKELNNPLPSEPLFFDKPHTSLLRSGSTLYLKGDSEIHHEVELGFMIGLTGKNIRAEDYDNYIEGYFLGIDWTDRDLQAVAKKNGSPWSMSKGQDGFFTISDFVSKDRIKDPHNLDLQFKINERVAQKENTNLMIFRVPQLIQYVSQYVTLNAGDIILTGTPAGVGPVKSGDKIEALLKQGEEILARIDMKVEKASEK